MNQRIISKLKNADISHFIAVPITVLCRHYKNTNQRFVAILHGASLLAPFFLKAFAHFVSKLHFGNS